MCQKFDQFLQRLVAFTQMGVSILFRCLKLLGASPQIGRVLQVGVGRGGAVGGAVGLAMGTAVGVIVGVAVGVALLMLRRVL